MKNQIFRTHISRSLIIAALAVTPLALHADDYEKSKSTSTSSGSSSKHADLQATDKESIIKNAAKINLASQKYAEIAQQKAQNQELKQFAQTLESDHQQAQQNLQQIAQKHNVDLPTSVDEKCKEEASRLQALSGEQFDREFAKGAVQGHAMAIAFLQKATSNAQDSELRQYTQQMLSKIRQHQSKGRQIAQSVGLNQTEITSLENTARDSVGGAASSATGTSDSSGSAPQSSSNSSSSNSSSESTSPDNNSSESSNQPSDKKSDL
jgi:putative membrane protein